VTARIRGLYGIVDMDTVERLGLEPGAVARALIAGGIGALQLRAKERSAAATLTWLRSLLESTRSRGIPLFANDRPDLASLVAVSGVHVGQEDMPVREVRRAYPGLKVGVSTHDLGQLAAALAERPDYVALGPIFPTQSKKNPDPVVGLEVLRQGAALAREAQVPLVAIGGITEDRVPEVVAAGAVPALIGALMPQVGPPDFLERRAEPGVAGHPCGDPYEEIRRRTERMARAAADASYRLRSGAA
jgi:thiamine-phosphate pyrophosphorylase